MIDDNDRKTGWVGVDDYDGKRSSIARGIKGLR